MDNGQHMDSPTNKEPFAPGTDSVARSEVDSANNLDLNSPSWNQTASAQESFGQTDKAVEYPKTPEAAESDLKRPEHETIRGEIIDPSPSVKSQKSFDPAAMATDAINHSTFKTTDTLNEEGIKATDEIIDKFGQAKTGDELAAIYDQSRKAMEDNLDTSFGREVGGQAAWN